MECYLEIPLSTDNEVSAFSSEISNAEDDPSRCTKNKGGMENKEVQTNVYIDPGVKCLGFTNSPPLVFSYTVSRVNPDDTTTRRVSLRRH